MTIRECIDQVDMIKPNQYTQDDKLRWLSYIDSMIIREVLKTHEGYNEEFDHFRRYTPNDIEKYLIAEQPYDQLYIQFIKMKIDEENGETTRYNNSAMMFNQYYEEYKKWYNRTHMPLHPYHMVAINYTGR